MLTDWPELAVASVEWPQAGILGHASDGAPAAVDADFLCAALGDPEVTTPMRAEDGRLLRCVDEHHPADCARCTPPPGPTEANFYVLRMDRGALQESNECARRVGLLGRCLGPMPRAGASPTRR